MSRNKGPEVSLVLERTIATTQWGESRSRTIRTALIAPRIAEVSELDGGKVLAAAIVACATRKKAPRSGSAGPIYSGLGDRDSNPGWLIQSQLSYH